MEVRVSVEVRVGAEGEGEIEVCGSLLALVWGHVIGLAHKALESAMHRGTQRRGQALAPCARTHQAVRSSFAVQRYVRGDGWDLWESCRWTVTSRVWLHFIL